MAGSCGQAPPAEPAAVSTRLPPDARTFFVKGIVKQLRTNGTTVVIQHEAIPDYMEAMTMPFEVKDPKELANLKPGDQVVFRMVVTSDDGWIDQVTRVAAPAPLEPPPRETVRQVRWVEPVEVGDALPDYPLTNQFGRLFHLADFKGRALAFTFFFTRCPFPTFCPRMSSNLTEAASLLRAQAGAPTNWHLLSISFDPEHDTPETLRQYGEKYHQDPACWTLATGALVEIDALTEQFGLTFARVGEGFDHNLRTVVVDPRGRIQRILIGNEWSPQELAAEILKAATVK